MGHVGTISSVSLAGFGGEISVKNARLTSWESLEFSISQSLGDFVVDALTIHGCFQKGEDEPWDFR